MCCSLSYKTYVRRHTSNTNLGSSKTTLCTDTSSKPHKLSDLDTELVCSDEQHNQVLAWRVQNIAEDKGLPLTTYDMHALVPSDL